MKLHLNKKYQKFIADDISDRYVILTGGRGSGKSFAASMKLVLLLRKPGYRILYTRLTLTSASVSIIPEFVEKINLLGCSDEFEVTLTSVKNKLSGSEVLFRGIKSGSSDQTANLKSLQGINVWVLDEAEEQTDEKTFDKIDLSVRDKSHPNRVILILNPSHNKHWMYKRFFTGLPPEYNGCRDGVTYIHTTYLDNLNNLDADYLSIAQKAKDTNYLYYCSTFLGHWTEESEGSLWTWNCIDSNRRDTGQTLPDFTRVVTAVDPAVTSNKNSDETGIVTAARGTDGHYYIIADDSVKAKPMDWAQTAIDAYRLHMADRVVAEVNQGGDMVEATLRQVDKTVSYDSVHASRGKVVRAEPISALYQQGLVHHIGLFTQLEAQMMTFTGSNYTTKLHDDRVDALVWALSYLMAGLDTFELVVLPPDKRRTTDRLNMDLSPSERHLQDDDILSHF